VKLPGKNSDTYELHAAQFMDETNTIQKTIKLVGCAAFSDIDISFLRRFDRNDIEHLADQNQNIIAFNNGYIYDIATDDYRRIGKEDFITKTMSIPYNNNIPKSKTHKSIELYIVSLMMTSKHNIS
jgi:hypothetical protein